MAAVRWTRRRLAAVLAAAPLISGQTQPASPSPSDLQKKADDDLHQTSQRLAQMEVPMNIAPAFVFRP